MHDDSSQVSSASHPPAGLKHIFTTSDRDLARLLVRQDSSRELLRTLKGLPGRGRRLVEQALAATNVPAPVAADLLDYLRQQVPDHPWIVICDELSVACATGQDDDAESNLRLLPVNVLTAWARRHAINLERGPGSEFVRLLEAKPLLADVILSQLGNDVTTEQLTLVTELAALAVGGKLRRAARSALHRLRQHGISIPETSRTNASEAAARELRSDGFLSMVDASGDQAVWVVEEVSEGGCRVLQAIIDEDGSIASATALMVEPKNREQLLEGILREGRLEVRAISVIDAMGILESAFVSNPTIVGKEYRAWRQASQADRKARRPAITPLPEGDHAPLVARSTTLLESRYCAHWVLRRRDAEAAEEIISEAEKSPLALPAAEQARRRTDGILAATKAFASVTQCSRLARRLRGTAFFAQFAGDIENSQTAVATANALSGRDRLDVPMLSALIVRSIGALKENREHEQAEKEKDQRG